MKLLLIKPLNEKALNYYESHSSYHPGDSGIDLFVLEDVVISPGETKLIDLGIQCEMLDLSDYPLPYKPGSRNCSYYLYPRSSISTKTPLVLANSTGIIDAGYRGNIMAAVKYVPTKEDLNNVIFQTVNYLLDKSPVECKDVTSDKIRENVISQLPKFTIKSGTRLVQICSPNLDSIEIKLVDNLSQTSRGTGGFGSTNKSRELL